MPESDVPAGLPLPPMPPGVAELPDSARLEWLWSEYEKQMEEVKHYQEEGMDIFPTPGFVLKTRLLSAPSRPSPQFPILTPSQSHLKFFVNLCSDPAIAMPAMQVDESGHEQLRVPMSAGPVSLDVEKDGQTACLVCDVVLNPDSIAKAQKEKDFRTFLASFATQKIEEKYKITLDANEVKWPKMRYKGAAQPPPQHIRRPKTAHVEEAREDDEPNPHAAEEQLEERRKAAALARIEALRQAEERESGISLHGSPASASGTGDVFLTQEQAESASRTTPFAATKEAAKIEVISIDNTPTASSSFVDPVPPPTTAAAAAASAAPSSAPATSGLPAHTITYLKSLDSDASVSASEWDMDLPVLPAAIRVAVVLPAVDKSSSELDVEINAIGVTVASTNEFRHKHQYQLHVRYAMRITREEMQFPFLLSEETSSCKYSRKTRTLTLTLPVSGRRDIDEEIDAAAEAQANEEEDARRTRTEDWQEQLGLTNTTMLRQVME